MTRWTLHHADCRDAMRAMDADSIDAIVTDPPYGLSFMGKGWDHGVPGVEFWTEALRVAKLGAHLVAFGGTRTFHRLTCAIEDAGWEVRDCLSWLYGSGFPKSLDVSKAIDKSAGAEREVGPVDPARAGRLVNQAGDYSTDAGWSAGNRKVTIDPPATDAARTWQGWGTALKPAWEPIILARKPLVGTVAANVLAHGTGAINVDACRVRWASDEDRKAGRPASFPRAHSGFEGKSFAIADRSHRDPAAEQHPAGRWPANVILDEDAAAMLDAQSGIARPKTGRVGQRGGKGFGMFDDAKGASAVGYWPADLGGGASRFFYTAKASRRERGEGNTHPTVKPLALMRWLVRMVTPSNGLVLDPFNGSGSTGVASIAEGFRYVGCEREAEYVEIARRRLSDAEESQRNLF